MTTNESQIHHGFIRAGGAHPSKRIDAVEPPLRCYATEWVRRFREDDREHSCVTGAGLSIDCNVRGYAGDR